MLIIDAIGKLFSFVVKNNENVIKIVNYLEKYGYIDAKAEYTVEEIVRIIVKLQELAGIQATGIVDGKTLRILDWPRCAHKDFVTENATGLNKWGKNKFTYYINSIDTDMSKEDWIETFKIALDHGRDVCNVSFERVLDLREADFKIDFGRGRANDLDSTGGTLAWQELPYGSNFNGQLRGMFDADETWLSHKNRTGRGIWAIAVIRHEILGHGLGLSHTNVANQLLNPFYSANLDTLQNGYDIQQLQSRYGKAVTIPTTPTTPTTPSNGDEIVVRFKDGKVNIDGYRVSKIN
jgi:hypothetical protein